MRRAKDSYVLHAKNMNHLFAPFGMNNIREVIHDNDAGLQPEHVKHTRNQYFQRFSLDHDNVFHDPRETRLIIFYASYFKVLFDSSMSKRLISDDSFPSFQIQT